MPGYTTAKDPDPNEPYMTGGHTIRTRDDSPCAAKMIVSKSSLDGDMLLDASQGCAGSGW
jgi:hypothetical protein